MIRSSKLFATVVALSLSPAVLFAQDAPKKVQRAVDKLFPDQKPTIHERRQVNGVQTYEASVERGGEARETALITENGDILLSTQRRTDGAPTPAVERIADQLFQMPMDDYRAVTQTLYLIDTRAGDRDYQIRLDATGRIRDAQTARDLKIEDVSAMETASGSDRQAVEGFVKKWNEGATIDEVYQFAPVAGYYLVQYQSDDGKGQIILNRSGRVYQEVTGFSQDKLPRAVQNTIEQVLKDADISNVSRATVHYYEFERAVGDDTLTLRIRPNGDVIRVVSDRAQEEERAVTAGAREERGDRGDRENRDTDDERQND